MLDELVIIVPLVAFVGVMLLLAREARVRRRSGGSSRTLDTKGAAPDVTVVSTLSVGLPSLGSLLGPLSEDDPADGRSTSMVSFENGAGMDEPTASRELVIVRASGQSDVGLARARNEDAILLLPEEQVFVVADGMGGHAGGDVASKIAVTTIEEVFREHSCPKVRPDSERPKRAQELVWALEEANRRIRESARAHPEYDEMGATIIGARFSERKQRAYIGHVGDSRCYRLRGGELRLLTHDHTLAAYGIVGSLGDRVRRALGVADKVTVDLCIDKPRPGDCYVLCSDGLNKMVDEQSIGRIVSESAHDLDRAARNLIDAANAAGGKDNVSVIVVGVYAPTS